MSAPGTAGTARLRRVLGLWDLVFYGIILIQPTAPMPLAKLAGSMWMIAGIAYGARRAKGFKRELVNLEMPPE